ncbi:MAG: hypothetical protein WD766_11390 [Gemmatimonadota bacterium]
MSVSVYRSLLRVDARSLLRDPLLGWLLLTPLAIGLLLRYLVPAAAKLLRERADFALSPFEPLIMGGFLMTAPGILGMVIGFLLLDERDAGTLKALRVTPLTMRRYLGYRIALPLTIGIVATMVSYALVGVAAIPFADLLAIAILASFAAPLLVLVLATAAANKVAGFAAVKVINAVNLLPVAAFFVPLPYQLAAGVLPTYWPMRALWSAAAGEPYAHWLIIGAFVNVGAVVVAMRLFERRLLRSG